MDLGNLVETIVHQLIIEGMTYLGRRDEFLRVSTLVYVMHIGLRPTANHDARLSIVMFH